MSARRRREPRQSGGGLFDDIEPAPRPRDVEAWLSGRELCDESDAGRRCTREPGHGGLHYDVRVGRSWR